MCVQLCHLILFLYAGTVKKLCECAFFSSKKRHANPSSLRVGVLAFFFEMLKFKCTALSAGLHTHAGCTAISTVWLVCSSVGVVPCLILFLDQMQERGGTASTSTCGPTVSEDHEP